MLTIAKILGVNWLAGICRHFVLVLDTMFSVSNKIGVRLSASILIALMLVSPRSKSQKHFLLHKIIL